METEIRRKRWVLGPYQYGSQTWQLSYELKLNINIHGHMLIYPVVGIDHEQVVSKLLANETTATRQAVWDDILRLAREQIPDVVDFSDPR